jgi:hypothetical protein
MIYFVQPQGRPFVKIGYAERDVGIRIDELQTANPDDLILLGTMPGSQDREICIHKRFAHLRVRGEWFHFTSEIRSFIESETVYDPRVHDTAPGPLNQTLWRSSLNTVQPILEPFKRVRVWAVRFAGRRNLMLQWIDPDTCKRRSKSAGTNYPLEVERRRADLEAILNGKIEILRNSSGNSEQASHKEASESTAANDCGSGVCD